MSKSARDIDKRKKLEYYEEYDFSVNPDEPETHFTRNDIQLTNSHSFSSNQNKVIENLLILQGAAP